MPFEDKMETVSEDLADLAKVIVKGLAGMVVGGLLCAAVYYWVIKDILGN